MGDRVQLQQVLMNLMINSIDAMRDVDGTRELAVKCSPASMAAMKRQVYADLERPLPDALAEANRLMLESFAAPDFVEGVASFVERRDPRFAALGA